MHRPESFYRAARGARNVTSLVRQQRRGFSNVRVREERDIAKERYDSPAAASPARFFRLSGGAYDRRWEFAARPVCIISQKIHSSPTESSYYRRCDRDTSRSLADDDNTHVSVVEACVLVFAKMLYNGNYTRRYHIHFLSRKQKPLYSPQREEFQQKKVFRTRASLRSTFSAIRRIPSVSFSSVVAVDARKLRT